MFIRNERLRPYRADPLVANVQGLQGPFVYWFVKTVLWVPIIFFSPFSLLCAGDEKKSEESRKGGRRRKKHRAGRRVQFKRAMSLLRKNKFQI